MKGTITDIGTSSTRVKAAIEEAMKDLEQPQSQHEAVQSTSWEEATQDLVDKRSVIGASRSINSILVLKASKLN